jgi:O-antigen ligase
MELSFPSAKKWLEPLWLSLLALYIISAPFEGYVVVPGFHGHSVVSLLQRVLVLPLPLFVAFLVVRKGERTQIFPLGIITVWLLWALATFVFFSPHSYYYLYYTWEQIAGFLLVLAFWVLARHPLWAKWTALATLSLYYLATLSVSIWEIRTAHHLAHSSEGGMHPQPIPTAFFYGPNHLGAALALILPFIFLMAYLAKSRAAFFASGLATAAGLYILYKTGSRGGELALIVEAAALPFIMPRPYKRYGLIALSIAAAIALAGILYLQSVPESAHIPFALLKLKQIGDLFHYSPHKVTLEHGPGSITIRLALLQSGWHALLQHPWGLGPRGAERYYLYYVHHKSPFNTYGVIDAHNMWLEIAIDFGWLGITLFVMFYSILLVGLYKMRQASDRFARYLAWSGFPALTGFIVGSVSPSSVMIGFNIMWIVYGLGVLALALPQYQDGASKNIHT